jgi:hypothetical protein
MAYVNQELKKQLQPAIIAICKKHGVKASLAVRHHSTLVLNIASGPIDFLTQYNERTIARMTEQDRLQFYDGPTTHIVVNEYHIAKHWTGPALAFLSEVIPAMNNGNHDESDIMTDYFDVGWYISINVGQWDKPYVCTTPKELVLAPVLEIDVTSEPPVLEIDVTSPTVALTSTEQLSIDTKLADRLNTQADKLQSSIDAKLADRETNTPKRMGQAAQARLEGYRLRRTQTVMRRLADMHTVGNCPPELTCIRTKSQVYERMRPELVMIQNGYHSYHNETGKQSTALASDPIAVKLWSLTEDVTPDPIKTAVEALQFSNIPGYFPTPEAVIDRMIEYADIEPEHKVLEPSAGSGNVADHFPGCDCIERHYSLANILRLKGHKVIGNDFLEMESQPVYDRIIANPPFDRGLDIVHIKRMIEWLAPGGRIVAIASGGPRQTEQLQPIATHWEALPAGSFKAAGTSVSSVLMVIDR